MADKSPVEVGRRLRMLLANAAPQAVARGTRLAFLRDAVRWDRAVQKAITDPTAVGDGPKDPGARLGSRTGSLRRAAFAEVTGSSLADLTLRKGTTSKYGRIHELGGVIKPVRKKWLTIPLRAAYTKSGVSRRPSARDFPNLRFVPPSSGKGPGAPARLIDKDTREAFFLLVKRVKIPARPVYLPIHEKHSKNRLKDLQRFILQEMRKGAKP